MNSYPITNYTYFKHRTSIYSHQKFVRATYRRWPLSLFICLVRLYSLGTRRARYTASVRRVRACLICVLGHNHWRVRVAAAAIAARMLVGYFVCVTLVCRTVFCRWSRVLWFDNDKISFTFGCKQADYTNYGSQPPKAQTRQHTRFSSNWSRVGCENYYRF